MQYEIKNRHRDTRSSEGQLYYWPMLAGAATTIDTILGWYSQVSRCDCDEYNKQ